MIRRLAWVLGFVAFWIGMVGGSLVNVGQLGRSIGTAFIYVDYMSALPLDCPIRMGSEDEAVITADLQTGPHRSEAEFSVQFWSMDAYSMKELVCAKDASLPYRGNVEVSCSVTGDQIRGNEQSGVIVRAMRKGQPAEISSYQGACAIHVGEYPEILPYAVLLVAGGLLWMVAGRQRVNPISKRLLFLTMLGTLIVGASLRFEYVGLDAGEIQLIVMLFAPFVTGLACLIALISAIAGFVQAKRTKTSAFEPNNSHG